MSSLAYGEHLSSQHASNADQMLLDSSPLSRYDCQLPSSASEGDLLKHHTTQTTVVPVLAYLSSDHSRQITLPVRSKDSQLPSDATHLHDGGPSMTAPSIKTSSGRPEQFVGDTYKERRSAIARRDFPFECGICGARYLYQDSAKKHHKLHHTNEPIKIIRRFDAPTRPLPGRLRNLKSEAAQSRKHTWKAPSQPQYHPSGLRDSVLLARHAILSDASTHAQISTAELHGSNLTPIRNSHQQYTILGGTSNMFAKRNMPMLTSENAPDTAQEAICGLRRSEPPKIPDETRFAIGPLPDPSHLQHWNSVENMTTGSSSATDFDPSTPGSGNLHLHSQQNLDIDGSLRDTIPGAGFRFEDFLSEEAYLETELNLEC